MLHRPWSIVAMATLLGLFAPTLLGLWIHNHLYDFNTAWKDIDPWVLGIALLSIAVSIGIWKVQPWGYFSYLVLSCIALGYLFYQYLAASDLDNYWPLTLATAFALGTCIILQRHVTAPYFNPRLRWWERDPRYRVHLGVKYQIDRQTRTGNLLDISRGGCFTELDAKLIVGEEIEMRVQLLKFDFTTRAKVIWHSADPKGYGLMFIGMTRRHQREIDRIIAYLIEAQGERGPIINQGIRPAL